MKKVSLLLIVAMLLSAIFAAIPASAAEAEKAAIDFTKLDYVNRDWKSKKAYTDEEFAAWITAKAEANSLSTTATAANDPDNSNGGDDDEFATAHFSKLFPIDASTNVTLYVKGYVKGYVGANPLRKG